VNSDLAALADVLERGAAAQGIRRDTCLPSAGRQARRFRGLPFTPNALAIGKGTLTGGQSSASCS